MKYFVEVSQKKRRASLAKLQNSEKLFASVRSVMLEKPVGQEEPVMAELVPGITKEQLKRFAERMVEPGPAAAVVARAVPSKSTGFISDPAP